MSRIYYIGQVSPPRVTWEQFVAGPFSTSNVTVTDEKFSKLTGISQSKGHAKHSEIKRVKISNLAIIVCAFSRMRVKASTLENVSSGTIIVVQR